MKYQPQLFQFRPWCYLKVFWTQTKARIRFEICEKVSLWHENKAHSTYTQNQSNPDFEVFSLHDSICLEDSIAYVTFGPGKKSH